jgi:hypothetical protein
MGKPSVGVYERFKNAYFRYSEEAGKEQYIVPYLMSSHPGSTLNEAVELALYLKRNGIRPEQVQDFYPTPGTISTVMYYTGIDPLTAKKVYCTDDYREKQLQRALLQYNRPENADLVREALTRCGRTDLIGKGKECLVGYEASSLKAADRSSPKNQKKAKRGGTPQVGKRSRNPSHSHSNNKPNSNKLKRGKSHKP